MQQSIYSQLSQTQITSLGRPIPNLLALETLTGRQDDNAYTQGQPHASSQTLRLSHSGLQSANIEVPTSQVFGVQEVQAMLGSTISIAIEAGHTFSAGQHRVSETTRAACLRPVIDSRF